MARIVVGSSNLTQLLLLYLGLGSAMLEQHRRSYRFYNQSPQILYHISMFECICTVYLKLIVFFFLWQDVISEPFEASPFMPKEIDDEEEDLVPGSQHVPADNYGAVNSEKENTGRENNVAKIKVVVY
jgi:hypothetical protein